MKTKNNSIILNSFGGIDHTKSNNDIHSASNIINYRILNDGSLEKRQGFRYVCDLGGTVRTFFVNTVNGRYTLFALIGNEVFEIDAKNGEKTLLGSIESTEGNACFFFFREILYLLDGKGIYEYIDGAFRPTIGYVPLVAKDWSNNIVGKINEPRNILNRHARATYRMTDSPSGFLCLDAPIASVEAIYVNGGLIDSSRYHINNDLKFINVTGLYEDDVIEVFFTYENGLDTLYARLCSSTSSALFGGIGSTRLFICGGNGTGTVFSTKSIQAAELSTSKKQYPSSTELYFPLGYEFNAGDGINAVQAVIRQYSHVLIFTEGDVWMVTPDDDGSEYATTTSVNARIGCPVEQGVALSDNNPISIGKHSVLSWETSSQNKCTATNISRPIADELSEKWLSDSRIYYDVMRNELWLYNRLYSTVWVYNTVIKAWYKFDGIVADEIFDLDGSVAFIKGSKLYVFDNECKLDIYENGTAVYISASYVTNYSDLGTSKVKTLSDITLRADLFSENLHIGFTDNSKKTSDFLFYDEKNSQNSLITARFPTGRFKHGAITLDSHSSARQKIHSITLNIR